MLIKPLVAPTGTTAVNWPKETPVTLVEATPLKYTWGVPTLKLAPIRTMLEPTAPAPGEKLNRVGRITKLLVVVDEPAGVLTRTGPVATPAGKITFSEVLFVAGPSTKGSPLMLALVAPSKLFPEIVTFVFARPKSGENPVTIGVTKKFELMKFPFGEVMVIGPLVTPGGALT